MTDQEPDQDGAVADAVPGNWVDALPATKLRAVLRLSRADRPAGTWLLFIPCSWGALLAFAAEEQNVEHLFWVMAVCAAGSFLMRGAGCTWNDISDRDIDAQVARTRSRPLPSGQVTPKEAVIWMCAQALLAFGLLLTLNQTTIWLGILALVPVCVYPFAKRFTWWPQVFLGIAFNWGALVGWTAMTDSLAWPPLFLYLGGIFWTLFYDTIYAHQDREDDALIGVKSTARLFGNKSKTALFYFLVGAMLSLASAIVLAFPETADLWVMTTGLLGVWIFGYHLHWQLSRLQIDDPILCWRLFRSNTNAGFIFTFALILACVLHQMIALR
ncbi:MAG: 4-hydroxybenzoate octaprenyltransferase [Pseudomonadota bacterium]